MSGRSGRLSLRLAVLLLAAVVVAVLAERYFGPLPAVVAGVAVTIVGTALLYREGMAGYTWGEQEVLLAAVLRSSPRAVLAVDREGRLLLANPAAEAMLGFRAGEALGKDYRSLVESALGQAGLETLERQHRRVLLEDKPCEPAELAVVLGGEKRFLLVEARPLCLDQGLVRHVAFNLQDISSQREMDDRLRRVETLSLVGQLAAGMAHEIRNPLTAVRGFTQLLAQKTEGRMAEYLEIMLQELDRANSIVEDFLRLARPTPPQLNPGNLREVLEEVAQLVGSEAFLCGVTVRQDYPDDLPPVVFDRQQLKQVFLNLVQNALAAMPEGGILGLRILWAPGDPEVRVEVTDTGVGMSEAVLARLGQPFFTTKENGTGLGLSISYRIVREHGGRVEVSSTPGSGSTFTLHFPLALPQELAAVGNVAAAQ